MFLFQKSLHTILNAKKHAFNQRKNMRGEVDVSESKAHSFRIVSCHWINANAGMVGQKCLGPKDSVDHMQYIIEIHPMHLGI